MGRLEVSKWGPYSSDSPKGHLSKVPLLHPQWLKRICQCVRSLLQQLMVVLRKGPCEVMFWDWPCSWSWREGLADGHATLERCSGEVQFAVFWPPGISGVTPLHMEPRLACSPSLGGSYLVWALRLAPFPQGWGSQQQERLSCSRETQRPSFKSICWGCWLGAGQSGSWSAYYFTINTNKILDL